MAINIPNARFKSGAYEIRISCGYDIHGKQIRKTKRWKPDAGMTERQIEKELQRQLVLFEAECKKLLLTANAVKFEALADEWLSTFAKINLSPTTYDRYIGLTSRIYPAIGYLRIDKITTRQLQLFVDDMTLNGKSLVTGLPLCRQTIVLYFGFINSVFKYAVRLGMIADNPCTRVELPKKTRQEREKEKKIYSISEIEQILEVLDTTGEPPLKMFIFLAIYSGCRKGELLGFEWNDVDFDNAVISVRRTSKYVRGKGTVTGATKTKKSRRSIKLPVHIINKLQDYRVWQDKEREKLGDKWVGDSDSIFTSWCGKPLHRDMPNKWFQRFCERNGFRVSDIHSMRHLYASLLINAGVDLVSLSGALGHSDTTTTHRRYCHWIDKAQARNSEAISNALNFGKKEPLNKG